VWEGEAGTNYRARLCWISFFLGGGGSINIFRLYKLSISDQTQITLKLRVRLSDFVQKYLDGQHLLGAQKTSLTGPESSLGSPETKA